MVAHAWANQTQSEARNSNSSLYFDGTTIYSYGRHFAIAKHTSNAQGQTAVLFTTRGYSNTTAKHKSIVSSAASHLNKIMCDDPSGTHEHNIEAFEKEIRSILANLEHAKKPAKYITEAQAIEQRAHKYAEFFGIEVPISIHKAVDAAENGDYAELLVIEIEQRKLLAEQQRLKNIEHQKQALKKWRTGKGERLYGRLNDRDYLRVIDKRIETSQGVQVPVEVGKRAYKFILTAIKKGGCNGECDYKILDFEVTSVTDKAVTIGCHTIDLTEIKKVAKKLSW